MVMLIFSHHKYICEFNMLDRFVNVLSVACFCIVIFAFYLNFQSEKRSVASQYNIVDATKHERKYLTPTKEFKESSYQRLKSGLEKLRNETKEIDVKFTIESFREKYPQYSDLDDNQLISALSKKLYPDTPVMIFGKAVVANEVESRIHLQYKTDGTRRTRFNSMDWLSVLLNGSLALFSFLIPITFNYIRHGKIRIINKS